MSPFRDRVVKLKQAYKQHSLSKPNYFPHRGATATQPSEFHQFSFQPIVGPQGQQFGCEAQFRGGSDGVNQDPSATSWIMLDNWLLCGFEELIHGLVQFLNCTRETLVSDFLSLLPHSAVFEISESVEPDDEVLSVCRSLKAAGYRIALDDFESLKKMEEFLNLADFIKVDFRNALHRERACMLRDLQLTRAVLIANRIDSEEAFHEAVEEGFSLFQGEWAGERVAYTRVTPPLHPMKCTCILGALEVPVLPANRLIDLINLEPGIEYRLLRRANWITPPDVAIDSIQEALEVAGKAELQKIVKLAMRADWEYDSLPRSVPVQQSALNHFGSDVLARWMEQGLQTPLRYGTEQSSIL